MEVIWTVVNVGLALLAIVWIATPVIALYLLYRLVKAKERSR